MLKKPRVKRPVKEGHFIRSASTGWWYLRPMLNQTFVICLCLTVVLSPSAAVHLWVKNCKELLPSSYNPERLDQPMEAANWLKNFRITNEKILAQVGKFSL